MVMGVMFSGVSFPVLAYHGRAIVYALQARSFSQTQARVLATIVTPTNSKLEGAPVFDVEVEYTYAAGGREFTSRRPALLGALTALGQKHADKLAATFAPGATVPVYFDAADPSRAVLSREVGSGTYIFTVFFTPFAAFGAVALSFGMSLLLRPFGPGGTQVRHRAGRTLVRLAVYAPSGTTLRVLWALWVAGMVFVSLIAIVIAMGDKVRSPMMPVIVWALHGTAVLLVLFVAAIAPRHPRFRMIIDEHQNAVDIPIPGTSRTIPLASIARVDVVSKPHALLSRFDTQNSMTPSHSVVLLVRNEDGCEESIPVGHWGQDKERADEFRWWLDRELNDVRSRAA